MFYLTYIQRAPRVENAFSQYGGFVHSILERYYKHELELFDLSDVYRADYSKNVTLKFPENLYKDLNVSYREGGQAYFDNFDDEFAKYEVVGVEKEISIKIGEYNFTGYIDLLLKDERGYYICDHKSKSSFKNAAELRHYLFQLYIYSKYVYDTYGEYPIGLFYNMFRAGCVKYEDFKEVEYLKALSWAKSTIDSIYEDEDFIDKIETKFAAKGRGVNQYENDDFFCNQLCSVRESCPRYKTLKQKE